MVAGRYVLFCQVTLLQYGSPRRTFSKTVKDISKISQKGNSGINIIGAEILLSNLSKMSV